MAETFVKEQLDMINYDGDSLFISGGRQGGKTYALAWRIAKRCAEHPNYNLLFTCKSDIQASDMYKRVINNPITKRNMKHCHSTPHKEIWFSNGAHAIFNSTREPDGLKGPTYNG